MTIFMDKKTFNKAFSATKWAMPPPIKKPKKKRNFFEENLQIQCVAWFDREYPYLVLFHVPNGGSRKVKISKKGIVYSPEGQRFKMMGVRKGVLDLFLMEPRGGYFGLWIEMKWADGDWSDEQEGFREKAIKRNFKVQECRTYEAFQIIIKEYLKLEPTAYENRI